jgi:hypothetical protein
MAAKKTTLSKNYYRALKSDLRTIFSKTILASRKNLNPKISDLIKDIFTK